MPMAWDYAELSRAAKGVGGPEKLLDLIEQEGKTIGFQKGQLSMIPWMILVVAVAVVLTKYIAYFKAKKYHSKVEIDQFKAELIRGINDYDATHPE